MQIIAKQRIENGLLSGLGFAACQSKNPQNPQSPKLPLYKEILQILPKLRKKHIPCNFLQEKLFYRRVKNTGGQECCALECCALSMARVIDYAAL
jgi:hypothetical protein